jgi:hypothetical protein
LVVTNPLTQHGPIFLTAATTLITFGSLAGGANAATILAPSSASTNMGEIFPASNTINQSGLSVTYTSLSTDLSTYLSSNPTSNHGFGGNIWGSSSGVRSGNFDLDLGGSHAIAGVVIWNLVDDPSAIRQFTVLLDDNANFTSPVNAGTYIASNTLGSNPNTAAELFAFAATSASFVRIQIADTHSATSNGAAFGEIAFSVVPEPSSTLLLGVGVLGFIAHRRRNS